MLNKIKTTMILAAGLFMFANETISLAPPLCINKDEVDHLVKTVGTIIDQLEKQLDI